MNAYKAFFIPNAGVRWGGKSRVWIYKDLIGNILADVFHFCEPDLTVKKDEYRAYCYVGAYPLGVSFNTLAEAQDYILADLVNSGYKQMPEHYKTLL